MPLKTSDLLKRYRSDVIIGGYKIDCATDVAPAVSASEEVSHIYGQEEVMTDMSVDNATLSLQVYDKKSNNDLFDVLQEQDPDYTGTKQYNWNNVVETSVWLNRKNKDESEYISSIFYKDWLPVPGQPAGDVGGKRTRTFAGNCDVPREYNRPILGEKLFCTSGASGYTATLSQTPVAIPNESPTVYAIRVVAISEQRDANDNFVSFDKEELTIDAAMVTVGKAVTIAQSDLNVIAGASHVYVNYLYAPSQGVDPTVEQVGIMKKVT